MVKLNQPSGNGYHRAGSDDLAIADHTKAIELRPDFAAAYTNRGLAYQSKGDFALAFTDHNKAIAIKPDYAEAYFNRGDAYKSRYNYDHALADFTKAIELRPDFAGACNHRGVVYLDRDDYDFAITDFTKAIDLSPDFIDEVYYNRSRVWLCLKEWQKAKSDLVNAREKGRDIVTTFRDDYGSVADFELITGIQLPADLAEMLTPQQ